MEFLLTLVILWALLCAILALEHDVLSAVWKRMKTAEFREMFLMCFAAPVMCVLVIGEYTWNRLARRKKDSDLDD